MSWEERLPKDYRVVLLIGGMTLVAYFGVRAWVVGVAQASVSDSPPIRKMEQKVDAMYLACIRSGECETPKVNP